MTNHVLKHMWVYVTVDVSTYLSVHIMAHMSVHGLTHIPVPMPGHMSVHTPTLDVGDVTHNSHRQDE